MKVRGKVSNIIWYSNKFNVHGLSEIIIQHSEYGADSAYIKDFDIFLEQKQEWKDMAQAFKNKDLITDNHNIYFFEPKNEEDRKRGFTLF